MCKCSFCLTSTTRAFIALFSTTLFAITFFKGRNMLCASNKCTQLCKRLVNILYII